MSSSIPYQKTLDTEMRRKKCLNIVSENDDDTYKIVRQTTLEKVNEFCHEDIKKQQPQQQLEEHVQLRTSTLIERQQQKQQQQQRRKQPKEHQQQLQQQPKSKFGNDSDDTGTSNYDETNDGLIAQLEFMNVSTEQTTNRACENSQEYTNHDNNTQDNQTISSTKNETFSQCRDSTSVESQCPTNELCHWYCDEAERDNIHASTDMSPSSNGKAAVFNSTTTLDARSHGVNETANLFDIQCGFPRYIYPKVSRAVIQSDYVKQAIQQSVEEKVNGDAEVEEEVPGETCDVNVLKSEYRRKAVGHFRQLRSTVSASLLKIASWILYRLLSRIFTSITFNKSQIEFLKKCQQEQHYYQQQQQDSTTANSGNGENEQPSTKIPLVYLPMHRSHLDAILISWILYMNNIQPPLVAAGDNMMIPFFGNLMRSLGAFFIKRSEGTKTSDGKNHLDRIYQAVLRSYIVENLKAGISLGIFLEGGRSRTGKILLPKHGLLSIITEALDQGILNDVFIVPVSISYEKLVDGNFVGESLGKPKAYESFVLATKAIWSTMHSRFGNVRVDFNRPFRLREFLEQQRSLSEYTNNNNNNNNNLQNLSGLELFNNSDNENLPERIFASCVACSAPDLPANNSTKSALRIASEDKFSSAPEILTGNFIEQRLDVEALGRHVLLNAATKSAIMPSHLVSFLLLNKYRKGVSLDQLVADFECISNFLQREKGINIAGCDEKDNSGTKAIHIVRQTLESFDENLIDVEKSVVKWTYKANGASAQANNSLTSTLTNGQTPATPSIAQNGFGHFKQIHKTRSHSRIQPTEFSTNNAPPHLGGDDSRVEVTYIKPVLTVESALQLHYYANNCTYSLLFESIMANALFSFTTVDLSSLIFEPTSYISNLTIDKREFLRRAQRLCWFFQNEFILQKSCKSLETELEQTFQKFIAKNIFVPNGTKSPTPRFAYRSNSINDRQRRRRSSLEVIDEEEYEFDAQSTLASSNNDEDCSQNCSTTNVTATEVEKTHSTTTTTTKDQSTSDDFRLLLTTRNCQLLNFYASILAPYLETYWLTAEQLALLAQADPHKEYEEKHVHRQLSANLQQLLQKGQIVHAESVSLLTIRNAVNYFAIDSIKRVRYDQTATTNTTTTTSSISSSSRRSVITFVTNKSSNNEKQELPIRIAAREFRIYTNRFTKPVLD